MSRKVCPRPLGNRVSSHLYFSRCETNGKTNAARRLHHRNFVYLRTCGWRVAMVCPNIQSSMVQALTPISHYTPTKAAILSLMQSCAVALGQYNIRANAILPGTIATDINKEDLSDDVKREGMIKRTCLGRLGGMSIHDPYAGLLNSPPPQLRTISQGQSYSWQAILPSTSQEPLSLSTADSSSTSSRSPDISTTNL